MKRFVLLIFLIGLLLSLGSRARANEPATDFCDTVAAMVGGALVEWVGYPQGWVLPDDLRLTEVNNFPQDGGLMKYSSASEQTDYYFVFWSYRISGEPLGQHDFCGPYRVMRGI